jgi:hypothetical protein
VRSTRAPLLTLIAIILGTSYLRLADLGRDELRIDELYQYSVAQSLNRGEGPVLPSGERYARGIDVTRLIALALDRVQPPEAAARLPSAIFGVVNVVLFAFIAWQLGGPWAAVAATLLLGVYPAAVYQSRFTRFYTYQLNYGLLAMYAGWNALRDAGAAVAPTARRRLAVWLWTGATAVALVLAARVQVTSMSAALGVAVAFALAAAADLAARGRRAWRDSVPLQVTALGLTGLVVVLVGARGLVADLVARAWELPPWYTKMGGTPGWRSYAGWLRRAFPILIPAAPVLVVLAARRNLRPTLYLLTWFGVPFLLHSLALPLKAERYLFIAVPGLLLVLGIGIVALLEAAYALVVRLARARGMGERQGVRAGRGLVAGAAIVAGLVTVLPKLPSFQREGMQGVGTRWRAAAAMIRSIPGSDTIPIGSTEALRARLYLGRSDFSVRYDELEQSTRLPDGRRGPMVVHPEGTPDFYAGLPILVTPDTIRRRYADQGGVFIVRNTHGDLAPRPLRALLLEEAVELCQGRCGTTRVYYWRFDGSTAGDRTVAVDDAAASRSGKTAGRGGATARPAPAATP